ncbi:hypothetical protein IB223_14545 [Pseudoxanthomonas sp. PXM03]|uniref:hypothetical protein n=1 Tax=Pseudoxanthomonas sp. PXM03 TaxID=2769284 RepID=UPI00177D493D|nr:hypothetical protein [Pseudoxanthomonas sp. PXM03]MBD9437319.1 hypothetical protein [Pseudoxanthomonas sp. PXM03]
MDAQVLVALAKACGVAGLAIGVMWLIYREILRRDIFPRLKQWQAFTIICLITVLIFAVVMTALLANRGEPPLPGELPASAHFQVDTKDGIFCEQNNVDDHAAPHFFDLLQVGLSGCPNTDRSGSRAYLVWPGPQEPRAWVPVSRKGYRHCGPSDFHETAPKLLNAVAAEFRAQHDQVPCEVTLSVERYSTISYLDIRNRPMQAAFIQSYRPETGFAMRQMNPHQFPDSSTQTSFQRTATSQIGDAQIARIYADFKPFLYPQAPN